MALSSYLDSRIRKAVFILLAGYSKERLFPIGTAFALSADYALIAYHCSIDNDSKDDEYPCLYVASGLYRVSDSFKLLLPLQVHRTAHFDSVGDWAIVRLSTGVEFLEFLEICNLVDLPDVDKEMRVCFCPVSLFVDGSSNSLETCMDRWERIYQYDYERVTELKEAKLPKGRKKNSEKLCRVEVSVDNVTTTEVIARTDMGAVYVVANGGLYGGCCGSPYLGADGKVIAIHLYSASDALTIRDAIARAREHDKKVGFGKALDSEHSDSVSEGYASMKFGVVLSKIPSFVLAYRTLFGKDLNKAVPL
jgi:hypothetical protein